MLPRDLWEVPQVEAAATRNASLGGMATLATSSVAVPYELGGPGKPVSHRDIRSGLNLLAEPLSFGVRGGAVEDRARCGKAQAGSAR